MALDPPASNGVGTMEQEARLIPAQTELVELLSECAAFLPYVCGRRLTRQQLFRYISSYYSGWVEVGALSNEAIALLIWSKTQAADNR